MPRAAVLAAAFARRAATACAAVCAMACLLAPPAAAARVDTVDVPSAAMGRTVRAVVAVPEAAGTDAAGRFPVVVLLHGASGSYRNWPERLDAAGVGFGRLADRFGVVLVAPDGGPDSWYFDSPADASVRMTTFLADELPTWIDAHLPVLAGPRYRAVAGLSMGGHGALYVALTRPGVYAAASALSGGVDLTVFPERWSKVKHLGPYAADTSRWHRHSVYHLARDRAADAPWPRLLLDCGVDDFFLDANRRLHALLVRRAVAHDYAERPGGHAWTYWTRVLPYHLAFFREGFDGR